MVIKKQLTEIRFFEYDLVVCHPSLEDELQKIMSEEITLRGNARSHPEIVSLTDHESANNIFQPVYALFKDAKGKSIINTQIRTAVSMYKNNIVRCFKGISKETHEAVYRHVIEKIKYTNEKLAGREIERILVLDDHQRKFYLGDACFWFLYNTKQTLHSITSHAKCTINCSNKKVYPLLSEMFSGSFEKDTAFTNTHWNEVDFAAYDLILCHPDSILKLLAYLDTEHPQLFPDTAIYYYNHMIEARNVIDHYKWNYGILAASPFIKSRLQNRRHWISSSDKEIVITPEQQRWADNWLAENGVQQDEHVVILIDSASTSKKLLHPQVFKELLQWILSMPKMKVLLFDEKKIGKKQKLAELYGEAHAAKIVVAEQLGIRKDMQLLSARRIKAVIGPCTGLLHLANSVYTYFKNNNYIRKSEVPLLLVYTGNINDRNSGYHPNDWWLGSLVKCAVLTKSDKGEKTIKKLGQCPYGKEEYKRTTLAIDEFTTQLLVDFIEANSSFFKERRQEPSLYLPA